MSYTQAQLVAAWTAASDGVAPDAATTSVLGAFANQTQTGSLSDANALAYVINGGGNTSTIGFQATTAVAWDSYEFFTGKSPTKAGLDYLVSPTGPNANNLNSAYYSQFSLENRYINFAGNLGLVGEGAAAFAATYGPMTFAQAVNVLYESIIGSSYAQAAGINVAAALADITGRQAAFIQIAKDRGLVTSTSTAAQQDIAVKAELVGYLLVEGIKADVGIYAAGANNFAQALINGNPVYNTDLLTYATIGGGTGSAVGGTGPTPGGTTQAFTTATDALVGTAGNDIFVGDGSVAGQVLASDSANGQGGSDTFRYFSNTAVLPSLTSVENINLVNSAADINLSGVTGLTFASIENNPTGNRTVTVANGVTVGLTNISNAGVNETFIGGVGQTSMTAVINGVTAGGVLALQAAAGANIATLNVQSTGATANKIAQLTSAGTEKTLNVSGGAALTITTQLADTVSTVDASTSTGGLNVTLGNVAAATPVSLKGGSGADTFNVALLATNTPVSTVALGDGNDTLALGTYTPTALSTFDGGNGTDTLGLSTATAAFGNLTAGNKASFTNFEILNLNATGAAVVTAVFDATTAPTGVTSFQVGGINGAASTAGISITKLAAAPSVSVVGNVSGTSGLTLGLLDNGVGTSDAATVAFVGGSALTGGPRTLSLLTATNFETINITSSVVAGQGPNVLSALTPDASLSKVNISGSGAFTLTTTGNLLHSATIDGSAATGSLFVDATATANFIVNMNGGSANDTLKSGSFAGNQQIYGGGGGDSLFLNGTGTHTLVYKAASDSLLDVNGATGTIGVAGASLGAVANTGKMDLITGFVTGQDKIDLTLFGLTNAQAVIADKGTLAANDYASLLTLAGTATFFQDAASVQRGISEVHVGTETYLFVDVNHDNVFSASSDLVIHLTGVGVVVANGDIIH